MKVRSGTPSFILSDKYNLNVALLVDLGDMKNLRRYQTYMCGQSSRFHPAHQQAYIAASPLAGCRYGIYSSLR